MKSIKFFLSHLGRSQFTNSDLCKISILHADVFALGSLKPFSDGGGGTCVYMYLQTMPRRVELEMRTFGLFLSIGVQTFIFIVEGGQASGRSRKEELAKMSPVRLLAIALGYRPAFSAYTWPGPSFSSELAALKTAAEEAELLWRGPGAEDSEKIQIESLRVQGRDHQTGQGVDVRDNAVFFRLPNSEFCSKLRVGLIAACVMKHDEEPNEGDSEETESDGDDDSKFKETDLRIILRNQFNHQNVENRKVGNVIESFNGTLTGTWPKQFYQQVDISECRLSSNVLCAPTTRDQYIGHFSKLL